MIEVKLPKCTVFLKPDEIQRLLRHEPELYQEALKRGKYILRSRQQTKREAEKMEKEEG